MQVFPKFEENRECSSYSAYCKTKKFFECKLKTKQKGVPRVLFVFQSNVRFQRNDMEILTLFSVSDR